jgi:hypothetical protein
MRFADTVYWTAICDSQNKYILFFWTVVMGCSSQLEQNMPKKLKLCMLVR